MTVQTTRVLSKKAPGNHTEAAGELCRAPGEPVQFMHALPKKQYDENIQGSAVKEPATAICENFPQLAIHPGSSKGKAHQRPFIGSSRC